MKDKKTVNMLRGNRKMTLEELSKLAKEMERQKKLSELKQRLNALKEKAKKANTTKPPTENQNNKASR